MRIEPTRTAAAAPTARRDASGEGGDARPAEGDAVHAKVPAVRPQDQPRRPAGGRGSYAPLIAQLIATRLDMPQTRTKRREAPATVIETYGRTVQPAPSAPSRLVRSV